MFFTRSWVKLLWLDFYFKSWVCTGEFFLSSTLKYDWIDEDLIMLDMHLSQISKLLKEDLLNTLHVCNQLQDVGEVSLVFQGINRSLSFKLVRFTSVYPFFKFVQRKNFIYTCFKICGVHSNTLQQFHTG